MARKLSEEPLAKMTLKLFATDIDFLRVSYGWGYSTVIRDLVRAHVNRIKAAGQEFANLHDIPEMTDE